MNRKAKARLSALADRWCKMPSYYRPRPGATPRLISWPMAGAIKLKSCAHHVLSHKSSFLYSKEIQADETSLRGRPKCSLRVSSVEACHASKWIVGKLTAQLRSKVSRPSLPELHCAGKYPDTGSYVSNIMYAHNMASLRETAPIFTSPDRLYLPLQLRQHQKGTKGNPLGSGRLSPRTTKVVSSIATPVKDQYDTRVSKAATVPVTSIVILGASITGMLAAAAVSPFVDEVVLIDKDSTLEEFSSEEELRMVGTFSDICEVQV